ncbi:GDSL-type esterase/lipase family protein [Radiobacillus sp. PE A8.2]|uniref:GDSL-type esterase/lipase family protein n=1 Tax=Radiobacillus sp. PE A8.2 TaxID=3380349 RepID=UPI003890F02E
MHTPLLYTALGDSLTIGNGTYFSAGFVDRYAYKLSSQYQCHVITRLHAKPKLTSTELLLMAEQPDVIEDIANAKIITITIGGNDLIQANKDYKKSDDPQVFRKALALFHKNIQLLIDHIRNIKGADNYIIQVVGLYNPLPDLAHSESWVQRFNSTLQLMESRKVSYIDIYKPFDFYKNKVRSGIHPNGRGYQIIANRLEEKNII